MYVNGVQLTEALGMFQFFQLRNELILTNFNEHLMNINKKRKNRD